MFYPGNTGAHSESESFSDCANCAVGEESRKEGVDLRFPSYLATRTIWQARLVNNGARAGSCRGAGCLRGDRRYQAKTLGLAFEPGWHSAAKAQEPHLADRYWQAIESVLSKLMA